MHIHPNNNIFMNGTAPSTALLYPIACHLAKLAITSRKLALYQGCHGLMASQLTRLCGEACQPTSRKRLVESGEHVDGPFRHRPHNGQSGCSPLLHGSSSG